MTDNYSFTPQVVIELQNKKKEPIRWYQMAINLAILYSI